MYNKRNQASNSFAKSTLRVQQEYIIKSSRSELHYSRQIRACGLVVWFSLWATSGYTWLKDLHARGPGFNSQLAPFPKSSALGVFFTLVSWSSWLWHLLNTQNVPSSILGEISFNCFFLFASSNYVWLCNFFGLNSSLYPPDDINKK